MQREVGTLNKDGTNTLGATIRGPSSILLTALQFELEYNFKYVLIKVDNGSVDICNCWGKNEKYSDNDNINNFALIVKPNVSGK